MKKYPLFKVHVDHKSALKELKKVLLSGFLNEGEEVTKLTNSMSSYLDHSQVMALNSCTSCLTLALKLANVNHEDEVITVSMTCVASNTPIHNVGGKIVWADIDHLTGNIRIDQVRSLITSKTKAVICVNWAGLPCDLEDLWKLCKENNIRLIQDAAHSFGAKYKNKQVCHFADYTCYSLQAIKHITSGDGGLLVVNTNKQEFIRAKKLKWFGIDRDATKDEKGEWKGQRWEADIDEAGYKFHMNNLTAAIGLSQLQHIDKIVGRHIKNGLRYEKIFKKTFVEPLKYPSSSQPVFWVYTVILPEHVDRDRVIEKMNELGINAGLVHIPNHNYSCFKESLSALPQTEYFNKHQISLPCGWWLTQKDIKYIANTLLQITK